MSIDDDCGATAAALEVVLGEQIRCEQDDGALHSAACASGRGYEEESGYGGDGRIWPEMPSPQLWVYQPPAVPSLLGELAVAGAGHPGVPL